MAAESGVVAIAYTHIHRSEPPGRAEHVPRIVDAVSVLGREKGISEEKLMLALQDAFLSAYKKQPGSAKMRARSSTATGDFRVID